MNAHHSLKKITASFTLVVWFFLFILFLGIHIFLPKQVKAETEVYSGVFTKRSGTGTQSITGLGFQPKAVIFYWTGQTSTGSSSGDDAFYGMGFSTGSGENRAVSNWSDQAVSLIIIVDSDSGKRTSQSNSIVIQTTNGSLSGNAAVTSLDSDGFTLNWSTSNSTGYLVRYVAIGGDDISDATVGTFSLGTSSGSQSVSGTGFEPDMLMFLSGKTTTDDSNSSDAFFSLGMATDPNEEGAVTILSEDNSADSDTCRQQSNAASLLILSNACNTGDTVANLTSFDSDGFTLNKSNPPSSATNVFYLALEGGTHEIGTLTKPTATGSQDITGVPLSPQGVVLFGTNLTTGSGVSSGNVLSFGSSSSSTEQGTISVNDPDGLGNPDARVRTITDSIYTAIEGSGDTLTGQAALTSLFIDGFNLDWTTANASTYEIFQWSIGSNRTITQSAYRFFENTDSLTLNSTLAAANTPASLSASGEEFRLRTLLHINEATLDSGELDFRLEYVDPGSGSCASPSGGTPSSYTEITGATGIAYLDNASISDGATVIATSTDPTHDSDTVVLQEYVESNNFSNSKNNIVQGEDGLWDFSLYDNGAFPNTTYCFRITDDTGTVLDTYNEYPSITTFGDLSMDIVDDNGDSVASPVVTFNSLNTSFSCQTTTSTLGTVDEKINIQNYTDTPQWNLSIAASSNTDLWTTSSLNYDFNDSNACTDGVDTDSYGGQLSIDPSISTLTPTSGCSNTGISLGSAADFEEGVTDSITLLSAGGSANTNCEWDLTGVGLSQKVPAEQLPGDYGLDLIISIIAS